VRIDEIFGILKEYIFLAIVGVIALAVLIGIGYFVIYKKLLRGRKKITIKQMIMITLIAGYLIIVVGVTFLNRGAGIYNTSNFNFLSSYKAAWNDFDVRTWQYLIFNIIMFIPLGILLPIAHKKFQNIMLTIVAGLILTILIEFLQFVTAFGIFELDDIFNNLLGAIVGYSMVMTVISLKKRQKHKYRKALAYFSPFLIVIILFTGVFTYYNLKEFGNLSEKYDYKLNTKNTTITSDLFFSSEEKIVPIYKAPTLSKDSAREFVVDFFANINIDTSDLEIIDYYEEAIYWVRDRSYNIWLNNLDGSISYTDFSKFDDAISPTNASIDVITEKLEYFDINIPAEAEIESDEGGYYEFIVEKKVDGNTLIHGVLSCSYYNDDTLKNIDNNLVVYEKVKDVAVISEKEAYENIKEGKFAYRIDIDKIDTIEINDIFLDYRLDSKGYLQPVYIFNSLINDEPYSIIIPALS